MMRRFPDIEVGSVFGRLTVIETGIVRNGRKSCKCRCTCGNTTFVYPYRLIGGTTRSCGCLTAEIAREKHLVHGMKGSRIYRIWKGMRERCSIGHEYHAKGITICSEWNDFEKFMKWSFDNGYADDLSIDRIDNFKGYSPENCRWVDFKTQERNKRNSIWVVYHGRKMPMVEAAELSGISYSTVYYRMSKGMTGDDLFKRSTATKLHQLCGER